MQIKEVCQITGLTPRTVRFYIEEGLIAPSAKRQYSGRRNISFCEADCNELREITVLRRAAFSLAEIKELRKDKGRAFEYAAQAKQHYEKEIQEGEKRLAALGSIDPTLTYDDFLQRLQAPQIKEEEREKLNIRGHLPKFAYLACLAICFVIFSYLNLMFIGLSAPTGQFSVYTAIASVILFLSVAACIAAFLRPKLGFIYILFELMVAAFVAYTMEGSILVALMLTGITVNAAFYVFYVYKTNLLMTKKGEH